MRLIYVVMIVGCGRESSSPDAFVTTQQIQILGQKTAAHAVSTPAGIDCGPSSTQCSHSFPSRSLVHLHIEQVDFACGTVTLEQRVGDGSGGTLPVPYDADFRVSDMDVTISCSAP